MDFAPQMDESQRKTTAFAHHPTLCPRMIGFSTVAVLILAEHAIVGRARKTGTSGDVGGRVQIGHDGTQVDRHRWLQDLDWTGKVFVWRTNPEGRILYPCTTVVWHWLAITSGLCSVNATSFKVLLANNDLQDTTLVGVHP